MAVTSLKNSILSNVIQNEDLLVDILLKNVVIPAPLYDLLYRLLRLPTQQRSDLLRQEKSAHFDSDPAKYYDTLYRLLDLSREELQRLEREKNISIESEAAAIILDHSLPLVTLRDINQCYPALRLAEMQRILEDDDCQTRVRQVATTIIANVIPESLGLENFSELKLRIRPQYFQQYGVDGAMEKIIQVRDYLKNCNPPPDQQQHILEQIEKLVIFLTRARINKIHELKALSSWQVRYVAYENLTPEQVSQAANLYQLKACFDNACPKAFHPELLPIISQLSWFDSPLHWTFFRDWYFDDSVDRSITTPESILNKLKQLSYWQLNGVRLGLSPQQVRSCNNRWVIDTCTSLLSRDDSLKDSIELLIELLNRESWYNSEQQHRALIDQYVKFLKRPLPDTSKLEKITESLTLLKGLTGWRLEGVSLGIPINKIRSAKTKWDMLGAPDWVTSNLLYQHWQKMSNPLLSSQIVGHVEFRDLPDWCLLPMTKLKLSRKQILGMEREDLEKQCEATISRRPALTMRKLDYGEEILDKKLLYARKFRDRIKKLNLVQADALKQLREDGLTLEDLEANTWFSSNVHSIALELYLTEHTLTAEEALKAIRSYGDNEDALLCSAYRINSDEADQLQHDFAVYKLFHQFRRFNISAIDASRIYNSTYRDAVIDALDYLFNVRALPIDKALEEIDDLNELQLQGLAMGCSKSEVLILANLYQMKALSEFRSWGMRVDYLQRRSWFAESDYQYLKKMHDTQVCLLGAVINDLDLKHFPPGLFACMH